MTADNPVYAVTRVVGTSDAAAEDAIHNAVSVASQSLCNRSRFKVHEARGPIDKGKAAGYQVSLRLGLRFETA